MMDASASAKFLNISLEDFRILDKKGLIKSYSKKPRLFYLEDLQLLKNNIDGSALNTWQVLKNKHPTNFTAVELFAGAGGLALGLENAGINCILLNEIDRDAAATLRINRPNWMVKQQDIREVDFTNISADIVTGGFPCQSFSYAGKRLGFKDVRGTLFYEYIRAIKQIKPKVVLAENVKGLEKHDNGKTLRVMLKILQEVGYDVSYKVLQAHYLDVPQKRERLVIIGVRQKEFKHLYFPRQKNYTINLAQALRNVPDSPGQKYTSQKYEIMKQIPAGGYWRDLPIELQKSYMGASFNAGGGKTGMARRLSWNEPSLTLTCNPAQKQTERCHPEHTRPLTIREYARIQSFPDEWQFTGSTASQYKQIGNAVPVNLGFHLGCALIATLQQKSSDNMEVVSF